MSAQKPQTNTKHLCLWNQPTDSRNSNWLSALGILNYFDDDNDESWRARDLDLDPGLGHTAYCHASLIDLYLHAKFHRNQRNVLWTDGCTDEHLRPALLSRLCQKLDLIMWLFCVAWTETLGHSNKTSWLRVVVKQSQMCCYFYFTKWVPVTFLSTLLY